MVQGLQLNVELFLSPSNFKPDTRAWRIYSRSVKGQWKLTLIPKAEKEKAFSTIFQVPFT